MEIGKLTDAMRILLENQKKVDNKNIEDTIESIFKNTDIIEVRQTNKKGLSQIQDPIN